MINTHSAMADNHKHLMMLGGCLAVIVLMCLPEQALAGTGGTEFDDVWTTVKDWTQGSLGRIVAGTMILVGVVGGIARQSLMGFALGAGGGMGLYNSPTIVEAIMSATLPAQLMIEDAAIQTAPMLMQLNNGLGL